MKTSNVSNLSIQSAMRLTILQAQNELLDSQTEVTTGKLADVGAELGNRTSMTLDLTRESERLLALIDTNAIATQRLESSQEAMDQMATAGQNMMNSLVALKGSGDSTNLAVASQTITDAFDTFISMANTSASGEYLFAGINTDVQPLTDMDTILADFETQFATYFGFPSTDTANTATITAVQMEDFITNVAEPMFTDSASGFYAWDTWSSATDDTMMTRISQTETVETSTTVNGDGMKSFALASVVSIALLDLNLGDDVRSVVSNKAIEYTGVAISGINSQRTQLGLSQERVNKANASLEIQQDILENNFTSLVEVDAYEASTRVNNLLSLVEASYTLTAKIQQLSLVNYL